MDRSQAIAAFAALSEATRLAAIERLVRRGTAGESAGALAEALGVSPSRLSFHLAKLSEAGLVTAERGGRQVIYRADLAALGALSGWLLHECCADAPEALACCALPARPR